MTDYIKREEIKNRFTLYKRAFLEGFKISGEGFNGEFPFKGQSDEEIWDRIKYRFKISREVNNQRKKEANNK